MLVTMKCAPLYLRTALHSAALISIRSFGTYPMSQTNNRLYSRRLSQASSFNTKQQSQSSLSSFRPTALFSSDAKVEQGEVSDSSGQEYASSYHAPVMYKECIDALLKRSHNQSKKRNKYEKNIETETLELNVDRPRIFIDGTLGGGGHSLCLLQNLSPADVLIGCDVDPSALATASTRLKDFIVGDNKKCADKPIFIPIQSNFRDLERNVRDLEHPITGEMLFYPKSSDGEKQDFIGVDGILLDLGISSHQIDNADRGFAFMKDGPLDMRMWGGQWDNQADEFETEDTSESYNFVANKNDGIGGISAADICNEFTQDDISRILKVYGDEPRSRKIAQSIVSSRPLITTGDLKEAVSRVTPEFAKKGRRMGRTATLARVFQALRIVVNEEDVVLRDAFEDMAPALIRKGGRLVVLAYHSMEDRAAKRIMRDGTVDGSRGGSGIEKDMFGNEILSADGKNGRPWKALGKKVKATAEEVEVNPRARSATLRVGERL